MAKEDVLVHAKGDTEMFQIGDHEYPNTLGQDEPVEHKDGKDTKPADRTEEILRLQAQLVDLQEKNTELLRFAITPRQNIQVVEPTIPSLTDADFNDLPDPMLDKKGFMTGVVKKMNEVVTGAAQVIEQRAARNANSVNNIQRKQDEAWELLREHYPDIAKFKDIVYTANTQYANELRAKNISADEALSSDTAGYVDEVAAHADAILKSVRGAEEEDGDEGRAQVLGGRTGGTGRGGRKTAKEEQSNWVKEIQSVQQSMKIY